jgi:ribosomal protein S18 acetylase RimI-like enzyme
MESVLDLRLLAPVDWPVLRAARLRALVDSPHAFLSHYALESAWTELKWQRMFNSASWMVAYEADVLIGLIRSAGELERPLVRHLESVWVAPSHRRRGVFRALLHALVEMEFRGGVTDLLLWVLENNHDARRAYEALGFEPTGERQFLSAAAQFEHRLRLVIGQSLVIGPSGSSARIPCRSSEPNLRPNLQPQEVHSLTSAADIVDAAGECLPVRKIRAPGSEEVYANVLADGV